MNQHINSYTMELNQNREMDTALVSAPDQLNTVLSPANLASAFSPAVQPEACADCEKDVNKSGIGKKEALTNVYAIGQVATRFPSQGVEQEFNQAVSRADTKGKTDAQIFQEVLSQPDNRYLVRSLCWVFTIEGLDTYVLQPLGAEGYDQLVAAIRPPANGKDDIDIIIGVKGRLAAPEMCGGLSLPMVAFDQVYSFDRKNFIGSIPVKEGASKKEQEAFRQSAGELFTRIEQIADNAGATNEHRALNYLVARYPSIYALTDERHQNDYSLSRISTIPSRLSGVRTIVDVVFSYVHRKTDVTDKYFVRVDVSEKFPFIVSKLAPYYDK